MHDESIQDYLNWAVHHMTYPGISREAKAAYSCQGGCDGVACSPGERSSYYSP